MSIPIRPYRDIEELAEAVLAEVILINERELQRLAHKEATRLWETQGHLYRANDREMRERQF